jgi:hypothetical protein
MLLTSRKLLYKAFMLWVDDDEEGTSAEPEQIEGTVQPSTTNE